MSIGRSKRRELMQIREEGISKMGISGSHFTFHMVREAMGLRLESYLRLKLRNFHAHSSS